MTDTYDPSKKIQYPIDKDAVEMNFTQAEEEYEMKQEENVLAGIINPRFIRWFTEDSRNDEPTDGTSAKIRYRTCKLCPMFDQTLKLCDECKCFMPIKVQLKKTVCPQGKW